jgi:heterodisulfide reductase subunit A
VKTNVIKSAKKTVGSVMVVGGGIAGVQASLDLANSGYYVYLVEKSPAIGGIMSQLDKTFPTNDCSMCILSPKLVECGKNLNIELLTLSEIESVGGKEGNYSVRVIKHPRYVDPEKCVGCGACAEKCPVRVPNEFDAGISTRKAIYVKYPQAVPLKYAIDSKNCRRLAKGKKCGICAKL